MAVIVADGKITQGYESTRWITAEYPNKTTYSSISTFIMIQCHYHSLDFV